MASTMHANEVEEEIQRILRVSGIESAPIDPSSLSCLRQIVQERRKKKTEGQSNLDKGTSEPKLIKINQQIPSGDDPVLDQLRVQTQLLIDMQRQLNALTAKVDRLEANNTLASNAGNEKIKISSTTRYFTRSSSHFMKDNNNDSHSTKASETQPTAEENNQAEPPPQVPQQRGIFGYFRQVLRLFWEQSRTYVRPLDGPLLFKLFFMLLVVISRVAKDNKRQKNANQVYKLKMMTTLLIVGFLYHIRYLQYLYQFFWKENVPMRVWKGEEDIVIPPPSADDANQNDADNHENNENIDDHANNENRNGNNQIHQIQQPANPIPQPFGVGVQHLDLGGGQEQRRNGFLWGGIVPRDENDENAQNNPVFTFVQDVVYLLGSFILSLLPFWNPEALPQPLQPLLRPRNQPQEQNMPAPPSNDDIDIPTVRPPRDAMEPESDDEEEEILFEYDDME